jgi:hypothetical protein
MSLPLAADGCILPNIRLHDFRIDFQATCGHKKMQFASIRLQASSAESAREYAEETLQSFKGMRIMGVWQVAGS